MNMKKFFIGLMVMLGLGGCVKAQDGGGYANADVDEFATMIKDGNVQLLDVRTPEEYADGHIAGAKNFNLFDSDFLSQAMKELNKNQPVAVYCRSGKRSAEAAGKLAAKGYTVTNLKGGIMAWTKAGEPTEK